jgi:hypothetical protein
MGGKIPHGNTRKSTATEIANAEQHRAAAAAT